MQSKVKQKLLQPVLHINYLVVGYSIDELLHTDLEKTSNAINGVFGSSSCFGGLGGSSAFFVALLPPFAFFGTAFKFVRVQSHFTSSATFAAKSKKHSAKRHTVFAANLFTTVAESTASDELVVTDVGFFLRYILAPEHWWA